MMSWLGRLFRRNALERELDKELRFHLDAAIADHVRSGMSREEAERRARIELGGVEQVKENARDARGTRWLEDALADTRYALRGMVRSPAFSAAAILTLAVGIGANTAVWSIMDALVLRMLPIDRPNELYALRRDGIEDGRYIVSHQGFRRLAAVLPDSMRLAAMTEVTRMYATLGQSPEPVATQLVSGEWFRVLGVNAAVGRVLSPADNQTLGGHPVAVLGAGFWRTRFGGDPGVVGKTLKVNGRVLTIVGVADEEFVSLTVGQTVSLWVPLSEQHDLKHRGNASSSGNSDTEKPWIPQPGIEWLTVVTRAEPGEVAGLQRKLDDRFRIDLREGLSTRDTAAIAYGMREHLVFDPLGRGFSPLRSAYKDPLKLLLGSVAFVLLIACANLAGLTLARGSARAHEMAVRVSLGARPGRLVRQVLAESLTLAAVGGLVSLLVAKWGSAALLKAASTGSRPIPLDAGLSGRVLLFAIGVSLATGLLFGLAPALRILRADLYESFRSGGRVFGKGSHRLPLGRVLIVSQLAMSVALVTSAGLFVRTFQNLLSVDPGYRADEVVTARIDVRAAGYTYAQLPGLHEQLLQAVGRVPGVKAASLSLMGFASGWRRISGMMVPGRDLPPRERQAQENYVSPEFFETAGLPILRGRPFNATDRDGAQRVVVISRSAANHFFGTEDVVGKQIGYGTPPEFVIVGVVADARVNRIREAPPRMLYLPLAQGAQEYITSVEARISGSANAGVVSAIRSAVAGVDRNLPLNDVATLQDLLQRGLTRERLIARLASAFGVLALLLAGIGLYGVIAYSVARRTNEMGVRLALGSSPAGVSWLVMRDSLGTIVLGLGVGMALWYPLRRFTEKLVYNVAPNDVATVTGAIVMLAAVGALAALLPALRASRVDPVEAIRAE